MSGGCAILPAGIEALMRLFREWLLARLVEKHAITQELASKLMA